MDDEVDSGPDKTGPRKRTKSGCITCRIRRVKCDETRPGCKRCAHAKRECDGYLPNQARRTDPSDVQIITPKPLSRRALAIAVRQLNAVGPAARILAPSPYLQDDVACFDFFRFRATSFSREPREYSQSFRGFWNCTLLQAAHLEPAVWHAVAALGAMYRKWEVVSSNQTPSLPIMSGGTASLHRVDTGSDGIAAHGPDTDSDAGMNANFRSLRLADQASACYTKALSLATAIEDSTALIVLSIGLAVTSNLMGKWYESSVHIQAGQKMMDQITSRLDGRVLSEVEALANAAESLTRLSLEWMSFNEDRARYPYAENNKAGNRDQFPRSLESLQGNRCSSLHRANLLLTRIAQRILAEAGLVELHSSQVGSSVRPSGPVAAATEAEKSIMHDLEKWEREIAHLLSTIIPSALGTTLDLLSVKLLHTTVRLLVAAGVMRPSYNELNWDHCLSHFERLIALSVLIQAQANPLLPAVTALDEPSINMSLWMACYRCRHPVLRRRALGLLRSARRLEGVWMSTSTSAAAERIIEVEEGCGAAELARAFRGDWAAAVERQLVTDIEAEDGDPRSWLGGDGARAVWWVVGEARTRWERPGAEIVPLWRRITQVDVLAEYSPRIGKSRGDMVLTFADRESRKQTVTVYF